MKNCCWCKILKCKTVTDAREIKSIKKQRDGHKLPVIVSL